MLVDTSGMLCYVDADEPFHAAAETFYRAADVRLTHSYVLAEFVALAHARRFDRRAALAFLTDLLADLDVEIVWVYETLNRAAVDFLRARSDKTYSLCDAVSFVLMRQYGITEALTTDHHFEQEGFRRLLK